MCASLCEDRNVLVLLVQSPGTVFAYWTLSEELLAAMARQGHLALRLYEGHEARPGFVGYQEVRLDHQVRNWYFRHLDACASYHGSLGPVRDGRFFPYLTSRTVKTPPDRAALESSTLPAVQAGPSGVGATSLPWSGEPFYGGA